MTSFDTAMKYPDSAPPGLFLDEALACLATLFGRARGHDGMAAGNGAMTLVGRCDGLGFNIRIHPCERFRFGGVRRLQGYLASLFPRHFELPKQDCKG